MVPPLDPRALSRVVIDAALRAADPAAALDRAWHDPAPGPVFLTAFGKASAAMAARACERLGDRLDSGVVIGVPERLTDARLPVRVEALPADHPLPTQRNVRGTLTLRGRVGRFALDHPEGTIVCLISGGGSAHLTLPAGDLTIEDLRAVNESLQRAGAAIADLNAVRKHTEQLKGGRLAAMVAPVHLESYLLSDVIGDALDAIASGPTAPDPTTFADALAVLDRHGCRGAAPAVTAHLERCVAARALETPKPGDPVFARVRHTIIANNRAAVDGVRDALAGAGFAISAIQCEAVGEAAHLGRSLARALYAARAPFPAAVILGGEPTVRVGSAHGRGGPSQELALAFALELERLGPAEGSAVVAFSTDGIDGPTDAAGACLATADLARASSQGIDPRRALDQHDSHTALSRLGALITTGPTGTNVNHVAVAVRSA